MAKLSARGHRVLAQWSRTSDDGQTTWHYALRSDGALLRRVTSRYTVDYGAVRAPGTPPQPPTKYTNSGHWTITSRMWKPSDRKSEQIMAWGRLSERMATAGYTEVKLSH